MRKGVWLLLMVFAVLLFSLSTASEQKTGVIVYFKDAPSSVAPSAAPFAANSALSAASSATSLRQMRAASGYDMLIKRDLPALNGFVAVVSPSYYAALKANPNVEVYQNIPLFLTLDQTANLVNASLAWNLIHNSTNITGDGETVCVIDSGINYSHPDLGGCTETEFLNGECNKVPAGYDFWNDEDDPMDHQGHGTHVAGIIASTNSVYRGMAPGARLVALQACDDGSSTCDSNDVASSLDWCIFNATKYNISVVSISIGTDSFRSSWCDGNASLGVFRRPIDEATTKNMTVVIATGNSGSTTGISAPACMFNATAVGSTTKSDGFAGSGNRNNITDLVAPGESIVSLDTAGTTTTKSGTSMATPHVSGAMALLRHYLRVAENVTVTNTSFLVNSFNTTGRVLNDSGGSNLNYTRINPYSAILSHDTASPNITFAAGNPSDGTTSTSNGSIFINVTGSELLKNATLEWSNGTAANYSMNGSGLNWHLNFSTPTLTTATYRVFANDSAENLGVTSSYAITLQAPAPNVSIVSPLNNSNLSGTVIVNASANTTDQVFMVNFTLYNHTHNVTWLVPMNLSSGTNVSGFWNATLITADFPDGKYNISVNASDTTGSVAVAGNVTLTIDNTAANATIVAPANGSAANKSLLLINASINDTTGVTNVSFRVSNYVKSSGWLAASLNSGTFRSGFWNASISLLEFPNGTYNVTANTTDFAGNAQLVNISQFELNGTFTAVLQCESLGASHNTYRLMRNITSDGTCLSITASNTTLDCNGFSVNYGTLAFGYGIDIQSVNSTTISECSIVKNGTNNSNNYGIHLAANTNATAVTNTTIMTNGTNNNHGILINNSRFANVSNVSIAANGNETHNFGIYILADSNYNNITSATIAANGTANNHGIAVEKSAYNLVARSIISVFGNQSGNYAVFFNNASENNTLLLNNITANSSDINHAIYLNNSNGNNITLNHITTATNSSYALLIENSNSSSITSNTIIAFGNFSFAVSIPSSVHGNSTNNSIYNNYFNTTARAVNVTGSGINNFSVAVSSGTNIIGEATNIGGNYYDNSTPGGAGAFSLSCSDSNRNGICDASLEHASNNTDFFPLVIQPPAPSSPAPSSSGGGGGGGGGGGAAAHSSSTSQSRVWDKITAGEKAEFEVTSDEIPFQKVEFTTNSDAENVEITVTKRLVKPSEVTVDYAGTVKEYMTISEKNVNDSSISSASVRFRVEKEWVFNNSATASSVVLARFKNGAWQELPTALIGSTPVYYNYSASSPGLSVFAISLRPKGEKVEEVPVNSAPEVNETEVVNATVNATEEAPPEPVEDKPKSGLLLVAGIAIVVAAAVFLIFRRHRHRYRRRRGSSGHVP